MTKEIEYIALENLALDPKNPRLGRVAHKQNLNQAQIYDQMKDWSLEELATSFLESGFWPHEAVLCVEEEIYGRPCLVVVEGNRRIAALQRLQKAYSGAETSKKWQELIKDIPEPSQLFLRVPFIKYNNRKEVDSFLGFRHVTGIKEWAPPEKAQFIAKLIDEGGYSYREVMRMIGSKTDTVERNYLAYRLLTQMDGIEGLDVDKVENKFSILFLALRSKDVQSFLGIESKFGMDPKDIGSLVGADCIDNLKDFSKWLFGDEETPALITDSRQTDKFARILSSEKALEYLRSAKKPDIERAFIVSGGDEEEMLDLLITATNNLQDALSSLHLYRKNEQVINTAIRLVEGADQVRRTLELPKND